MVFEPFATALKPWMIQTVFIQRFGINPFAVHIFVQSYIHIDARSMHN